MPIIIKCPNCGHSSAAQLVEAPGLDLRTCPECQETMQVNEDGSVVHVSNFLRRLAAGDQAARAAVSPTRVVNVVGFLRVMEEFLQRQNFETAGLAGSLRTLLAQVENRATTAISRLSKYEFVDDEAREGIAALRELKELVTGDTLRQRGVVERST